jgi:hypothetical protein
VAVGLSVQAGEDRAAKPLDRHWAFCPPQLREIPTVHNRSWVRTPVDAFVLAKLEQSGLQPASPSDRWTLLRRITVDLTGLPPTPDEIAEFLADSRPDAYERVVNRLLASPHYGERWAQHWLDVVRYAESNGYEVDGERPHAWRYRDYMIRAFNEDKPFDRFLLEQIAGDELARDLDPIANADLVVATGFNRCGPVHLVSGNTDPEVNRQEVLTEMTNGVGATFLGLTFGCARCHDHKFDPITQVDYYGIQAFFAAAQPKEVDIATVAAKSAHKRELEALEKLVAPLKKQVAELEAPYQKSLREAKKARLEPQHLDALAIAADKRTPEQKKLVEHAEILLKVSWDELVGALAPEDRARRAKWREQIHEIEVRKPPPVSAAWAIRDDDKTPPTHILKRGDPKRKGEVVLPNFPRVLSSDRIPISFPIIPLPLNQVIPSRIDLARWLTRPDHPLTARVLVNRIWQHHFGRGIVETPNDFGLRGAPPTHPDLLDWLATEFVTHGWSIKHLHRLMVLSSTYQQSSRVRPSELAEQKDPGNRLLWRMNRQRLEGEAIRDNALAVVGTLNHKLGGPMVRVPLEPEVYDLIFTEGEPDGLWPVTPNVREHSRRSIYLFAKRNVHLPLFEAFDQPDSLTSCPRRPVSTFAPQALIMMNGPFMQEQSKLFATRLVRECGANVERQIDRAYCLALGRQVRPVEKQAAVAFLAKQAELAGNPQAALADFCLALLNCNEFVYVN